MVRCLPEGWQPRCAELTEISPLLAVVADKKKATTLELDCVGRGVKIYVDADACPVKEQVYRVAARHRVPVVIVANSFLRVPPRDDIEAVRVPGGFEAVDDWIAERASDGDVVATADLPLAARVVDRGAVCIDFRGKEFTADALGGLLASREIARHLRDSGSYGGGPPPLSPRDRGRFAGKLDEVIHRLRRASGLPKGGAWDVGGT